jgi:UMF1 family MFS transporter
LTNEEPASKQTDLILGEGNLRTSADEKQVSKVALFSWALYDWANSPFFAVIQTFVFATYFIQSVAQNVTIGTAQWGNTIGIAGVVVAILGPGLGALADQFGRRKPWILGFSLLCIASTAALWFVKPDADFVFLALVLVFLGTIGSEWAIIFYNAMLPDLAAKNRVGRLSGWAWGLGYAGGLVCLLAALFGFIKVDTPPFGLNAIPSGAVRATFILAAFWYLIFSLPLFLKTPDTARADMRFFKAIKKGWRQLRHSLQQVKKYRSIFIFLIARLIFIDALATVFAFGGIYAAGTFHMQTSDILLFGVGLNLTAGIGAALFAWIDDWLGSRSTMLISLVGLMIFSIAVLLVYSVTLFWITGLLLGLFVGPVQAASRTYMARVAPDHLKNEMFGLMAFSGKVTAFIGPFLVGWITYFSGSQRMGMSIIVVMFLIGFLILLRVPSAVQDEN